MASLTLDVERLTSDRALRFCMQVIVLVNLVFVHMTGSAGLHWLAPLYVLALAAPVLRRYREKLLYVLAWNGYVLCFAQDVSVT